MKKRIFIVLSCVFLLFAAIVLPACANETEALQERISTLEGENAQLQSTVSTLSADLERTRTELSASQTELQSLLVAHAIAEEQASQQDNQSGPLAITYGGEPNTDMTWPMSYGELSLGLRINLNELDDDVEIEWRSGNENVFTFVVGEDGTSAVVTPVSKGSAQMIVTVGDRETRSWIRIT